MNTVNYIVSKLPTKPVLQSISNSSIFSIQVSSLAEFENLDFESFYLNEIDTSDCCFFSFYFNITELLRVNEPVKINRFKNKLLQFFFHIRYKKINDKPVLFFEKSNKEKHELKILISEMEQFSLQNGFEGLECIFLDNAPHISGTQENYCYAFDEPENLAANYYQLLKLEFYTASIYTVKNVPEELLPEADKAITSAEKKLQYEFNPQFTFMKNINGLSKELAMIKSELKHSNEELKNHQSYLEILKSQDEALKINDFYHSEYEILPLWYKKIGHIIKVITGKRTLHSLFDNNVKKYKN